MPTYNSRSVRKSLLTRLGLERMEERDVPAFYLVTGTTDIVAPAPTLGDGSAGDPFQVGSLRTAIDFTNASAANDTIILQAGTYQLTDTTNYDLEIADAVDFGTLSIIGAVGGGTTIQGAFATPASNGRIFNVLADANFTLSNATLTGGEGDVGGAILANGGSATQLTLTNVTLTDNQASFYGGAVAIVAYGGDITTTFTNVTLSNNEAGGYGGALAVIAYGGDVVTNLTSVTMSNNEAGGYGGALAVIGYGGLITTLTNSTVSSNTALSDGGGISSVGYGGTTLTNTTVSGNTSTYGSGGGIAVTYGGTLNVNNSTVNGNTAATGYGGGIAVLGDFYGGTLDVSNSTVSGNSAGFGGGIGVFFDNSGTNTLTNSTVSGNIGTYDGGGLYLSNSIALLDLVNSTVSGNSTNGYGGGLYFGGGNGSLTNLTVTNNRGYGGGIAASGTDEVDVQNSIVAGNFDSIGTTPDDVLAFSNGSPFFFNYSLIGVGDSLLQTAPMGNLIGTAANPIDPRLGALADNGGPTLTHALLADSPARNAGDPSTGLSTDQRGQARVLEGRADIGAFESVTIVIGPTALPASTSGSAYTAALTATGASGPFTYTVTAGALPPGLTLSPTGELTGTPTAAGTYTFTIGASGPGGTDGTREFSLTVAAASATPPKFVLGAGSNGRIQIAGGDGATIPAFNGFQGEVRVATADLNGDGVLDVIAGAGAGAPGGHIKVFDGSTGAELRSFFAFTGFAGGVYVSTGDINGDGVADLIVGAGAGAPGGHVKVFDGKTGELIRSFFAFEGFAGGARVASGDINGDGTADIIVGAGTGGTGGHVKVFDGKTGELVRSFFAFDGFAGGVFVGAADLDGDGTDEILAGADAGSNPEVRVFGATNTPRLSFLAYAPMFRGGVRVAGFDVNGDGRDEIVTGSGPGSAGDGRVFDATGQLLSVQLVPDVTGGIFVG